MALVYRLNTANIHSYKAVISNPIILLLTFSLGFLPQIFRMPASAPIGVDVSVAIPTLCSAAISMPTAIPTLCERQVTGFGRKRKPNGCKSVTHLMHGTDQYRLLDVVWCKLCTCPIISPANLLRVALLTKDFVLFILSHNTLGRANLTSQV